LGTTYYWRVDEVNGVTFWKGNIWQFTTNDGTAFDPDPADSGVTVPIDVVLEWGPGCLAASHDVYFGTDFNDVNDANSSNHPNVEYSNEDVNNSFDPNGDLDYLTVYYWRVDAVNDGNLWRGEVWSFRSESAIVDPNLRLWYKFDGNEGDVVYDSSGREFHSSDGTVSDRWEPNDGWFGGSLWCDDDIGLAVSPYMLDITDGVTISVWLKDAYRSDDDNTVFGAAADSADPYQLRGDVVEQSTQQVLWRAGNDSNDVLRWDLGGANPMRLEGWHHWAFVKNELTNEISIYFDGRVVESSNTADATLSEVAGKTFKVGSAGSSNTDLVGHIDDFRVYDFGMSAKEVGALYRAGDLERSWAPSPYNGQTDVQQDIPLSWMPGDYADSHDLYFGTDWDDINDVNTSNYASYPNVDYNHTDACSYDPGLLDLEQIYYWRVDEVNDSCDASPWKGRIWKFTVAGYVVIDDMEAYTGSWAGEGDHPLDEGWADYYANGTNALITLQTDSPVRDEQSMEYAYDNAYIHPLGYCSEIQTLELSPTDWTDQEVRVLTLWFYGWPDNDANDTEQMYVGVKDDAGLYAELRYGDNEGEDMNDIKIEDWQTWDVPLTYFSDSNFAAVANDVNLADVNVFSIGFGERYGSQPGGSGYVYFDDIRLYPPFCDPERVQLEGDLNGDCTVDFGDIEIMADEWLETDVNLGEVTEPCDANLLGWWKLDDGSGDTAVDSSTYDHNGVIQIIDVNVWWVSGRDANALEFSGGRVRVPDHPDLRPLDEVSASAWIYFSEGQSSARVVVKGADNKETFGLEVSGDDELVFQVRDGNDPNASSYPRYAAASGEDSLDRDEWIHIAGTYDGNVAKCYVNGELAGKDANAVLIWFLSQDTNDLAIGNRSDDDNRGFEGTIDDVRVYNYGLSAEEIGYLASDGDGIVTVSSIAELYYGEDVGKRAVNFKDLAKLASGWRDEELWP
jgi:hypothetical protein